MASIKTATCKSTDSAHFDPDLNAKRDDSGDNVLLQNVDSQMDKPQAGKSLTEKLKALRLLYLQSLAEKIAEIEASRSCLNLQSCDARKLKALQTSVHRLAGSAGSFGLVELGEFAHGIDVKLRSLQQQPAGKWQEERTSLQQDLDQFVGMLKRAGE